MSKVIQEDFHIYGMKFDETLEEFVMGDDYIGFSVK